MPSQYLPDTDHIVRIVKPSLILWNENKTAAIGVFPGAFKLRETETNLSVSWLEHFPGSRVERMQEVRDHADMELRNNHGFAVLNVGEAKGACDSVHGKVRVIHEPTPADPSHSAIHRYPRDHDELYAILAAMAANNLTLNRDIPKAT